MHYIYNTDGYKVGLDSNEERIKNNLKYEVDMILLAESTNDQKLLVMKVTEENTKSGLQLNIK